MFEKRRTEKFHGKKIRAPVFAFVFFFFPSLRREGKKLLVRTKSLCPCEEISWNIYSQKCAMMH